MVRLFGTDGIRGVAGEDLTGQLAMDVARAAASVLHDTGAFAAAEVQYHGPGTDPGLGHQMLTHGPEKLCPGGVITVSGGGELNTANNTANDLTTVTQVADLTITKTHTWSFAQGQQNAAYTVTVSNAGPGPTNGTVTVTDTIPTGESLVSMAGTGWTCPGTADNNCTRADALIAGAP